MEQKNGHAFKEEQIDWNALAKAGIGRNNWNRTVNFAPLLQGRETGIISLRLKTPVIDLVTDATLRIVETPEGRPVLEINGIRSEEKQHN